MASYLNQTETWKTRDGRLIKLEDLELSHLKNIVAMLERKAETIEMVYSLNELGWLENMPMGDHAQDAFENALDERARNPVSWLRSMPLLRELNRLIAEKEGAA